MTPTMSADEMVALSKRHTFFSWSAQAAVNPIPMVKAKGVYFWDAHGKRYLDLNSQLMCVNIGHGDQRVIDAIKAQADELVYAGPGMVVLLGEPAYYGRFGFVPASSMRVEAPDPTWGDAFQARTLGTYAGETGTFRYAAPFDDL